MSGTALTAASVLICAHDHTPGISHSLRFYWQTIGGVPWHPEFAAPFGTTFSAPSVRQVGNSSVIAAQGPGHSLRFYWQTIGAVPWNPELVAGPGLTFA